MNKIWLYKTYVYEPPPHSTSKVNVLAFCLCELGQKAESGQLFRPLFRLLLINAGAKLGSVLGEIHPIPCDALAEFWL